MKKNRKNDRSRIVGLEALASQRHLRLSLVKSETCLLIHRKFACWDSAPAVHLAISVHGDDRLSGALKLEGVARGTHSEKRHCGSSCSFQSS